MKRNRLLLAVFGLVAILWISACQPAPLLSATPDSQATPSTSDEIVLTVEGSQETRTFNMEEIKALPAVEGQAGIKSSTGKITVPALFKGVLITELLKQAGGGDSSMAVQVEANDGYAMTYSYDQIDKGVYITYDPATGDEIKYTEPLQTILAYEINGQPLDPTSDGYLRLAVISDKNDQVVDGHWAIKWVTKISIKPLVSEWTLDLSGAIDDQIDRGSFESCSTEKCHQASWTDGKAQTWVGVPLWTLVARVDDSIKHDTGAFNKTVAEKGYTVEVIAKDGFSATFDSGRVANNDNMIVAFQVNGNPLGDKDFPLHLVGSDATKKDSIGAITKIVLHLSEQAATQAAMPTAEPTLEATAAATAETSSQAASDAALSITGLVENGQSLSMEDLKGMEIVKTSVEHPKKGKMDVEGIKFSALLEKAGLKADAKTLVLTASDGYTVEVDLKAVLDCPNSLVAFDESGILLSVLPDLESSAWVKDLVGIEVK